MSFGFPVWPFRKGAPQQLGMLDLTRLLLEDSPALEKPCICGYRTLSMCQVWEVRTACRPVKARAKQRPR